MNVRLRTGVIVVLVLIAAGLAWYLGTARSRAQAELVVAAMNGDVERARISILKGADVNMRDESGNTPLSLATQLDDTPQPFADHQQNHTWLAFLLVARGANVNAKDSYGQTPLHYAAVKGDYTVLKLLLKKGGQVNARNNNGQTPLHWVTKHNAGGKIAELLLASGAQMNAKDKKGVTPLARALEDHNMAVASVLRKHGAK